MNGLSDYKHIVLLIYKHIIGHLTPEEENILTAWRKADERNEALFRRLTDTDFLEREFRRLNVIDSARPQADMQARIRKAAVPKRRRTRLVALVTATAAAAMLCIGYFMHEPSAPESGRPSIAQQLEEANITTGKTQAVLTLSNGKKVSLGGNAAKNQSLIAQQEKGQPESRKERINQLATPRGGEFKIMLEDSTVVWLNAESKLVYPDNFNAEERRVAVTGEAYFEVAKDSLRPFYVESGDMTVRVYGTEFNVNAYAENNQIYTTLVSGSIALQPRGGGKGELVLTPGHQAVFHKEDCTVNVRSVDAPAVTSWHEGRFTFEEQTLGQIMRTLSRWYNFEYAFEDAHLADIIFKGSAPRYAELSEVLYILESSGGIGFRVENRKIIITTNK